MAIVGIDLGTTNSLAAHIDAAGRIQVIHNAEGANLTPSVVWFESADKVLVGAEAKKMIGLERHVYKEFKRQIGTNQEYDFFSGKKISPTDLSALVLKKLKADVEASVGRIKTVVVTVPANFRNEAREATMAAARHAGFDLKHIVNEPTAAALYYAHSSGQRLSGNYVVYDLGGGTLDVSVIHADGEDIQVLASEGVQNLGGKDFDQKVLDLVARKFKEKTGIRFDSEALNFTAIDAEEIKKTLSVRDVAPIRLISKDAGPVSLSITRQEFESEISSLVAQAEMLCEGAVLQAGIDVSAISEIFLAGGSSRIPLIKKSVKQFFRKEPTMNVNPDEVIALGAALYAAHKAGNQNLNPLQARTVEKLNIQDIAPAFFGTISLDSAKADQGIRARLNNILINKGEKLPCSRTESFYTVHDDQTAVTCTVTQSPQSERDPRFVRVIWTGDLELPGGRPKSQELQVTFSYTENGTLQASFLDVASNRKAAIDLKAQGAGAKATLNIEDFIVE
jgi:molecular chaperone DnaK